MFDREKFREAVATSGLTKAEIAFVYGVSRMTVYDWLKEGEPQHPALRAYVDRATRAILRAVKENVLPLSDGLSKPARKSKVAAMQVALTGAR